MWRYVTQQWELIKKLELKDQLVKELEELERLAKKYKDDAEERQNQAASAAFNRATGAQKDMMIKILSGTQNKCTSKLLISKARN